MGSSHARFHDYSPLASKKFEEGRRALAQAYDVVIVGGGAAGLSAALVLGRCRRTVLVCDEGHPRNAASLAAHCLLGNEGIAPSKLLAKGRQELSEYEGVVLAWGAFSQVPE